MVRRKRVIFIAYNLLIQAIIKKSNDNYINQLYLQI